MKKRILKIMVLIAVVLLPLKANATGPSGTLEFNCTKTKLSPNEETTCTFSMKGTTDRITAIGTQIAAEDNLTIVSVTKDSAWTGDNAENLQLYETSGDGLTGNFDFATIKIKAGTTIGATPKLKATKASITGSEPRFIISYTSNGSTTEADMSDVTKTITIVSNVNTLNSLSLSESEDDYYAEENDKLAINFQPSQLNYRINAGEELKKVTIRASLTSNDSSFVEGYGPRTVNLTPGENKIELKVKAENGDVKTYTVTIVKPGKTPAQGSSNDTVKVEDTGKTLSIIVYVIGGILLICGIGVVTFIVLKKKQQQQA